MKSINITKSLRILSGSHNIELAEKVAKILGTTLTLARLTRFANSEIKCQLEDSVRGADVFVFQTHSAPVNEAIMEQAIMIDAAKRASAGRITAVCPFFGYARQDRKAYGREPITAKLVVDILKSAGADRIASVDLHSGQIQGFFDGPFDHLVAMPSLEKRVTKLAGKGCVVIAPDAGRVKLSDRFANRIGAELAIVHKQRRSSGSDVEALRLIGDVKGKRCVIVDDIIDGAGTVCAASALVKENGAASVMAVATHGIFSEPAIKRLKQCSIDRIVVTDTLPLNTKIKKPKIEVVSVAELLADAVLAIFQERSVSALFGGDNQA